MNLGQDSEARLGQDFEVFILWRGCHIAQEAKRLRLEEALGAPIDKHALPVPHIGNMGDQ